MPVDLEAGKAVAVGTGGPATRRFEPGVGAGVGIAVTRGAAVAGGAGVKAGVAAACASIIIAGSSEAMVAWSRASATAA